MPPSHVHVHAHTVAQYFLYMIMSSFPLSLSLPLFAYAIQHVGSWFPNQESNLALQWQHRVLTIEVSGRSWLNT